MAGLPSILTMISLTDAGGTASWGGTNGIENILLQLADVVKERGVMVVESTYPLSSIGADDAGLVAKKGVGLYAYNPSNILAQSPDESAGSGGGKWEFLCALGPATYNEVIGNSVTTTFDIEHNLNTLTPVVLQLVTLTGLPYTYVTTGTVSVIDANTVRVVYVSAPGTNQITIAVKR